MEGRLVNEATFDSIESPQYLNFNKPIEEATDSYFERKNADSPADQSIGKNFQKLPTDFFDDVKCEITQTPKIEEHSNMEKNNNKNNRKLSDDFGGDLIQSVQTLALQDQPSLKSQKIITSTPFRVAGVEPMPWRPNAKHESKHCTIIRPFSFEERNKQILQRKAHRVQTILQAEKEARKFRANPVPKFLKKTQATVDIEKKIKNGSDTQQLGPIFPRFRAKSPKVLRRAPFQPNLPKQPLMPPQPFVLNSEIRAKDREIFDQYVKEKERLEERLRELRLAAQKRREEEEIIKMRKEMVIKAQPIRKFKCVSNPVSKRPLTEPMTPMVIKRQRR